LFCSDAPELNLFKSGAQSGQRHQNEFAPCSFENWGLSKACFDVALKAVAKERDKRFSTKNEFHATWDVVLFAK